MMYSVDNSPAPVPEFSTALFAVVTFILGFAIIKKNHRLDAFMSGKKT